MIPTESQLTTLRLHPHLTKLYLGVYQPSTILAARVNDASIVKGAREITFDSVTAGSYTGVRSGMTLYVGSSAGLYDKGMVRVRSASSTILTIAENSHINWSDDDYLTVINFFEINAIFPRIIQDPSDSTQTLWYKDYDIEYTNQNSVMGTFVNMGPHHAAMLENGLCNVYYSASGTYNILEESLSYEWIFEGATVTGSSSHTPGNITYTTPGHYTTRLTVTSASGGIDTSYRHISIFDRPGGANPPVLDWELMDLTGSRDQGGYTGSIRILESVPESFVRDGSLVVIFAEDWYGDKLNKQSLGGNALGRSSIVFVGYVMQGSTKYNYRESTVEFKIGSPSEVMKQTEGFSVSIRFSNDPSTATSDPNIPSGWVAVLNLGVRKAMYHYLRWHSTVLMTNDFEVIGTGQYLQYWDADRTSIYDAIQSAMRSIHVGNVVCDRQGKIWAERDVYVEQSAFPTTFPLTNQDWIGDVSLEERRTPQTSFIEMGGIYFTGPTGLYYPLLANAPGNSPGYRGNLERIQGLALGGQSDLNTLVGNVYAQRNIIYPNLDMQLAGNYRVFDIAPQEKLPITLSLTDTVRGISFTNKNFYINRMSWQYDPRQESFLPSLSAIEIGSGFPGDTVPIPAVPSDEGGGYIEPTIPEIVIPPFQFGGAGFNNFTWERQTAGYKTSPAPSEWRSIGTDSSLIHYTAGETELFHAYIGVPPNIFRVTIYRLFALGHPDAGDYQITAHSNVTINRTDGSNILVTSNNILSRVVPVTMEDAGTQYKTVMTLPQTLAWTYNGGIQISTITTFTDASTANARFVGHLYLWG